MKAIETLSQNRLFKSMSPKLLEKLASVATVSTLGAGDAVVKQGTRDDNLYLVAVGTVRVMKEHQGGNAEEVARIASGSTLGEMAFIDGEPRSTSIEAMERTELVTLPGGPLKALLDKDFELGSAFYRALATVLTRRLRGATEDVASLRSALKQQ